MKFYNPLQMNDWPVDKFLTLVLSIQFSLWALIGLDLLHFHLPLLRELFSVFYLGFLPGVMILRILKQHHLGNIQTTIYAVALSISVLMLVGFLSNLIFPLLGISQPISLFPLLLAISLVVLLLCYLTYTQGEKDPSTKILDTQYLLSPAALLLCALPLLAVFGTYSLNYWDDNTLQMLLLLIIALLPIVALKWIPQKLYPLLIFMVSLSLLLHCTLVSSYLWGADVNAEYYLSSLVSDNGIWNFGIGDNINAMLSVVIIAPLFSILGSISLVWLFKIVYPLFFSLIPLGMYLVYRKLTNARMALLACLFFVFCYAFYTVLTSTVRQQIGELFLVSILILVFYHQVRGRSRSLLLLIFGLSVVVSHYGLTYILLLIILLAYILKVIFTRLHKTTEAEYNILNPLYLLFLLIFALTWFIYVSSSSIFSNGVVIGTAILNSVTDVFNPSTSQGLSSFTESMSFFKSLERLLYILAEGFIALGVLGLLKNKWRIPEEYRFLALGSLSILIVGIALPFFAGALNTDRLLHIASIFISIFLVTGFLTGTNLLNKYSGGYFHLNYEKSLYLLAVFLMFFLLFNSAFTYQLFDQDKWGRFALDNQVDFLSVNPLELKSVEWISYHREPDIKIYADLNKAAILFGKTGNGTKEVVDLRVDSYPRLSQSYIYLGKTNLENQEWYIHGIKERMNIYTPLPDWTNFSRIYDNGDSWILKGQDRML